MGIKNFTKYVPTAHCIERAHERFDIYENSNAVVRFFQSHVPTLEVVRHDSEDITTYGNPEATFVLNTTELKIITCYETQAIDNVRESFQAHIEKEINVIVRVHQMNQIKEFCKNEVETLRELLHLAETLPNTRRGDMMDDKTKHMLELSEKFSEDRTKLIGILEVLKEYKYE